MPYALLLSFHPETNLLSLTIVTLPLIKGFKHFVKDKEVGLIFFFRFILTEDVFVGIG